MEKAALYIRVSTEEQTEYSPQVQLEELIKYAAEHNMAVETKYIFKDEGLSGRNAEHRPAFMQMIHLAKKKPRLFDVILCHKFDRFARNREDSVLYKALLKKDCGIKVVSIKEPIPQDDKFGVIYESMLEAMAEYYSLNLAEEVKKTMVKKAHQGEYQAHAPLGYKNKNKTLAIDEEEGKIICMVFSMFLNNKTCFNIAKELNRLNIKTKRGNLFDGRAVKYILQNPVYIGFSRWTPTGKAGREISVDTIVSKGTFLPLITPKTFYDVQAKMPKQKNIRKNLKDNHWFSGIIKCDECQSSLICGEGYKNGGCQMQCGNYNHGFCKTSHSISSNIFEKVLFSGLNRLYAVSEIEGYNVTLKPKTNPSTSIAKSAIKKLSSKLEKAKDAYLSGIDTSAEYKQNKETLQGEIDHLSKSLEAEEKVNFNPHKRYPCLNGLTNPNSVIEKIVYCKTDKLFKVYFAISNSHMVEEMESLVHLLDT